MTQDEVEDFNPNIWLEDTFGIDVNDPFQVYYTYGLLQQAYDHFEKLWRCDEYTTYFHEALYHGSEPLSYEEWIEDHDGHNLFLVISLMGGVFESHQVFADLFKAVGYFNKLLKESPSELKVTEYTLPLYPTDWIETYLYATDSDNEDEIMLIVVSVDWKPAKENRTLDELKQVLETVEADEE